VIAKKIKEAMVHFVKWHSTPPEIALGVAIGAFIAVLPLYGLHTVLVIIAIFLIPRANKIAILLGTNISLPPTLPFITWGGYEIGRFILRKDYPDLQEAYFKHLNWQTIKSLYYPLFIGSIVLGLICAVILYLITFLIVKKIKNRHTHVE